MLHHPQVALFTTTYYPDAGNPLHRVRAGLATAAIRAAIFAGFEVIVVDGGSDPALFPIEQLGAQAVITDDGDMVAIRQRGAARAVEMHGDITHAVWFEPEKDISQQVLPWVTRAIAEDAAVLVPMRMNVRSYPLHQQLSERAGNEELAHIFGREMGDHYFGPRIFRRDALERHWLRDYREYGTDARQWASIFAPVFGALAEGVKVVGLPVDFVYPSPQREAELQDESMVSKRHLQNDVISRAALQIRDRLTWVDGWKMHLLDGFTLDDQVMDALDIREPSSVTTQ